MACLGTMVRLGSLGILHIAGTSPHNNNPHFPALRSGHRLFQRPSPGKQFPSNKYLEAALAGWRVVRLGPNELTADHVGRLVALVHAA